MSERVSLLGFGVRVAPRSFGAFVAGGHAAGQPLWLTHRPDLDYRSLFFACLQQPLVPTQWLNPEEQRQHAQQLGLALACAAKDWGPSCGRPPAAFTDWLLHVVFAAGGLEALLSFSMPNVQDTWRCSWQVRSSAGRMPQLSPHPQALQAAWEAMERVCGGPSRYDDDRSALVVRALAACHHVADVAGLSRCATLLTAQGSLPLRLLALPPPSAVSVGAAIAAGDSFVLLSPYRPLPSAALEPAGPAPSPAPGPTRQFRRQFFGSRPVARAAFR